VNKLGNILFSIIVPIFNSSHYIDRCLNSLRNQTYSHIEIICVNDGSTDDSLERIQHYVSLDERFKVVSQVNQGVSVARNHGLDLARGAYIIFVDSDDWLELDSCNQIVKVIHETDTDVVIYSCSLDKRLRSTEKYLFDDDYIEFIRENDSFPIYRRQFGLLDMELANPERLDYMSSVCLKAFRREIVENNNIRFENIKRIGSFEDGLFNIDFFYYIKNAVYIRQPLYHYWKDNKRSITSVYNPKLQEQRILQYALIQERIDKLGLNDEYRKALSNRIALSLIPLGLNEESAPNSTIFSLAKSLKLLLSQSIYRDSLKALDFSYFPLKWMVFFRLCKREHTILLAFLIKVIQKLRKYS